MNESINTNTLFNCFKIKLYKIKGLVALSSQVMQKDDQQAVRMVVYLNTHQPNRVSFIV